MKKLQSKICFVLESFFPSHRAGTEVYVLNLCNYFKNKGWDVHIIITTSTKQEDYIYETIPIHTFQIPKKPLADELNGLIPPRGIIFFIERIKELKPDIVHFHTFGRAINSYHLKAVKDLGIKTAFTPHLGSQFCVKGDMRLYNKKNCDGKVIESRCLSCQLQSKGYNKIGAEFIGKSIALIHKSKFLKQKLPAVLHQANHRNSELIRINKYSDIIFSIAPWIQDAFNANGIKKAKLIPQGISPIFFESIIIKSKNSEEKNTIHFAFIGRIHTTKGFHLLKEAWENLPNNINCKLHVLTNPSGNSDSYFDYYKNWASNKKNVVLNLGLDQKGVAAYLNKIDVLILPSISNEVAPLVILEAATRKIPVIGSDYIAIKGMIIHNKNGLLFKNGKWESLLKQIEKMLVNNNLISELSHRIERPYSMNQVSQIIEEQLNVIS